MHLFLVQLVGRADTEQGGQREEDEVMGDNKMWWIHLGSTRRMLSLAQIRGLILETSLQSRLQYFFTKENLNTN